MEVKQPQADLTKPLSEQMGVLVKNIKDMREKADSSDAVNKDEVKKMQKDIGDMGATLQATEIKLKEMEKAALRLGPEGDAKENEDYTEKLDTYLRTTERMDKETAEKACFNIARRQCKKGTPEKIIQAKAKALVSAIKPDGGYFITPERTSFVVDRIFETSPVRQVANIMTTVSNEMEMIIDDNEIGNGGWVQEQGTRPETTTPQIELLKIPVHEQYANPYVTQTMIDDAGFDIEGWIARKAADKISRVENTAFVNGSGAMKPKGFMTLAAWAAAGVYERGKLEQKETAGSLAITYNDLISLQGLLKEAYQPPAVWIMKREVWAEKILTLNTANNYLFVQNANQPLTILSKRIILADDMTGLTAGVHVAADLPIIYGDFGVGYTIVDRLGIRVLRDPYSSKPYIQFYTTKRVGGAVTNYESLKIMKIKSA